MLGRARRQEAWLGAGKLGAPAWRPRKLVRLSAKRWVGNLGLQFGVASDVPVHVPLHEQRFCGWGRHLGQGQLCRISGPGAPRVVEHRCTSGRFAWRQEGRHQHAARLNCVRESMGHALASSTPETLPLFQAHTAEMSEELHLQGIGAGPNVAPEEFVWKFTEERARNLHRRAAMNRFYASIEASVHHGKNSLLLAWTQTGGADRVAHRGAGKRLREGGLSVRVHVQLEDRGLKAAAQNCIAISAMVLQYPLKSRVVNAVLSAVAKEAPLPLCGIRWEGSGSNPTPLTSGS